MALQENGVLLREAIKSRHWNRAMELLRNGVSQEAINRTFKISVRHRQWDCAREIATLDNSRYKRNVVIAEDIRHLRWPRVIEFIQLGVSIENENKALRKAVKRNMWNIIPKIVRYSRNRNVLNYALTEARKKCQWPCIRTLVELGLLSEEQKEYICDEALTWGHLDCAVEILRKGINEAFFDRIVHETLKWNQWHSLAKLLQEETVKEWLKLIFLKIAVHLSKWEAFSAVVLHSRLTNQELTEVMRDLVLERSQTGRRVFKQLCARQIWSAEQARILFKECHSNGNVELAFHVAVMFGMWNLVITFIQDVRISARARRLAFLRAVRQGAWRHVKRMMRMVLIKKSDKRFAFLEAVRHGEWEWVLKLHSKRIILDEDVETAVNVCFHYEQWRYVFKYCCLCKEPKVRHRLSLRVLVHAVKNFNWKCIHVYQQTCLGVVPENELYCNYDSMIALVVQEAIKYCEWNIVLELVRLGGLSENLKEYVSREALFWGHLDCAVEILKQGVSEVCAGNIVNELLKWNQWHIVFGLLNNNVNSNRIKFKVLKTAVVQANGWDIFTSVVYKMGITNHELNEVLKESVLKENANFLHLLIAKSQRGCRVFKHLCLKHTFPTSSMSLIVAELYKLGDKELAFYVAVTQKLWDLVILYIADDISMKNRKFALLQAIKHGAWPEVKRMLCTRVFKRSDRRLAFLQAIRSGACKWAIRLFNDDVIPYEEMKTAIMITVSLGHWNYVVRLCTLHFEICESVLLSVISEAIAHCKWKCVREIFRNVLDNYEYNEDLDQTRIWRALFEDVEILKIRKLWNVCVPSFNKYFLEYENLDGREDEEILQLLEDNVKSLEFTVSLALIKWCTQNSFDSLGILIAIARGKWSLVDRIVQKKNTITDSTFLQTVVERIVENERWKTFVSLLKYVSVSDIYIDSLEEYLNEENLPELCDMLRKNGLLKWLVNFAFLAEDWSIVENELDKCTDRDVIVYTMHKAIRELQWRIVCKLLDRNVQDIHDLKATLRRAIQCGATEVAGKILQKVDPLSANSGSQSILRSAVMASDNREDMVRLCITSGMSTYQCGIPEDNYLNFNSDTFYSWNVNSPMTIALYNGQLPLVKMLYGSGSCTNRALFRLKTDNRLRLQLQNQGRHDILEFVDMMATTPLTLSNLCRLTVSHAIGVHPDRSVRVQTLPVPKAVQEYIMFKDVVHPDYCKSITVNLPP